MKLIFPTIMLLILIFALYYYFDSAGVGEEVEWEVIKNRPINQVSLQHSVTKEKLDQMGKKEGKIKAIKSTVVEERVIDEVQKLQKKAEPETDYISAYRDWQYFQNCYTDVEDFLEQKDPLDTLRERFENNPRESQSEPTAQQNTYYQHHVDICKGMIENDEDDYYTNMSRLESIFTNVSPITDEEKQLEKALLLASQLKKLKMNYTRSGRKKSNLAPEEFQSIKSQINQITEKLLLVYESNEELSEEENQLLRQYAQELEGLNLQISKSYVINDEHQEQVNQLIDTHLIAMDEFLKGVISPDAFLVIADRLFRSEYYQKDSTVLGKLKNDTGIWDSYYIDILNKITMPLIACSMDYPCDADSDYMLSYCLGLRDSMFNQACGLDLEDFYFSFYIGANQLNDVNIYFQYMAARYGH